MSNKPHLFSGANYRGQRIGLLGGSFNPAHQGHLHISLLALKEMNLDAVWWLVSPQNPLKSASAPFTQRFESAEKIIKGHPQIVVSDLEVQLGTQYTADTLRALKKRFPHTTFIWMMGADNLLQIPRWQRWTEIFGGTDVAVFRRPSYAVGALRGIAAQRFNASRLPPREAQKLGTTKKKHWVLFNNVLNFLSATQIRDADKKWGRKKLWPL